MCYWISTSQSTTDHIGWAYVVWCITVVSWVSVKRTSVHVSCWYRVFQHRWHRIRLMINITVCCLHVLWWLWWLTWVLRRWWRRRSWNGWGVVLMPLMLLLLLLLRAHLVASVCLDTRHRVKAQTAIWAKWHFCQECNI